MEADCVTIGDLVVRQEYEGLLREYGLCAFDALFATSGDASLKKLGLAGWRERIVLSLDSAHGPFRLYLKRYNRPPLRQQLARILAGHLGTAQIECHWLDRLAGMGVSVPCVVACGARTHGFIERQSLLVTTEVPGESLERWLPRALADGRLDRKARGDLARALADLVARLHGAGLFHRDLYLSHVFVRAAEQGGFELSLIDLQRIIAPRWRKQRRMVKDLAALNYSTPCPAASQSDRLRWLKWYVGHDTITPEDKMLVRAIARKTARIARHSEKHGLG